jgi:hypothetical protein
MERPEGLVYRQELLCVDEERSLLDEIERLRFDEIRMHGAVAKRTARHFGLDYDYERRDLIEEAEPMPEWLLGVRGRAAELAGVAPDELIEALVQLSGGGADRLAPRRADVRHRSRSLAPVVVPAALPPRAGGRATDVRAGARAAVGLRPRRAGAHRVAAPCAADEGAPLLDHIPNASPWRRRGFGEARQPGVTVPDSVTPTSRRGVGEAPARRVSHA